MISVVLVLLAVACVVPPPEGVEARWAAQLSGPSSEDEIDGVAAAPDGTAYVTGKFEHRATLGGVVLASAGAADIPLARFARDGTPLWVQRFGGPGEDNLFDIDADASGAVATGWFAGTVDFGATSLTAAGPSDCVVLAVDPEGSVRWARRFGGPGADGCNEVVVDRSGAVTTSIDTQGGWTPTDGPPLPSLPRPDTVLMRLTSDGDVGWMRTVGGDGWQRGKALAVAPDGSVAFGGDTRGDLRVEGIVVPVPPGGGGRDAWLSRWSPTGARQWVTTWGGIGDDLAKGVADDGRRVTVVGPVTGVADVGEATLDAGPGTDLLVAQWSTTGSPRWATAISAPGPVAGAELVGTADGGVLFSSATVPGIHFGSANDEGIDLDDADGGTVWLAHYGVDGSPSWARTIPGTAAAIGGEIARSGSRVYLDVALWGADNEIGSEPLPAEGKDAAVWALDLTG